MYKTKDLENIDNVNQRLQMRDLELMNQKDKWNSNSINFNNNNDPNEINNNVGEITGNYINPDTLERGLPMRSHYTIKKPLYDQNDTQFDIFDKTKPSNLHIKNNDPYISEQSTTFANINESTEKISNQLNPYIISLNNINTINLRLYEYIQDIVINKSIIINGVGLNNLFSSLYLISNGLTEIELKKFFNYEKKNILYKGLISVNEMTNSLSKIIKMRNIMIISDNVPYNSNYYNSIKHLCLLIKINHTDPINEARKTNLLIKKMMKDNNIKNLVTPDNFKNLQLMFLTTAIIKPVWNNKFDEVIIDMFNQTKKMKFMSSRYKSYGYYEDEIYQLLEINCMNNCAMMGFILTKKIEIDKISDTLKNMIDNIKKCIFDEVRIPCFEQNLKMRYNNTLKDLGLNSIFTQITSSTLFPEKIVLQDVIQNIKIVVNNTFIDSNETVKGYKTTKKFIVDRSFIYYIRIPKTNTILFIGTYEN